MRQNTSKLDAILGQAHFKALQVISRVDRHWTPGVALTLATERKEEMPWIGLRAVHLVRPRGVSFHFSILCWLVSVLDRVNVGFAALTMNKELGLTAEMFGFGAGIFFFGYFIFEVPSNLILERVGARRWIARIMISWGVIAASFAFVPSVSAIFQGFGL